MNDLKLMLPDIAMHELAFIYTFSWITHVLIVLLNKILEVQSFFHNFPQYTSSLNQSTTYLVKY